MDFDLPHSGEENVWIVGIHGYIAAAGVLVHEQGALPGFATVGGAKDAALRLWAIGMAHGTGQHDVGVMRINNKIGNAASLLQSHFGPSLARIRRLVDPAPHRDVAAHK